jgi:nitrogen fixation protein FixH
MPPLKDKDDGGFRITGRHVLFGVIGFFAVVIGVDALFMTLAIRTYPGQVSATPFEDGLAYNRTLAAREAQARLGYRAAMVAEPAGPLIRLTTRDGAPLRGATLAGALSRPATEAGRRLVAFEETAPGHYRARAAGLSGAWDLVVTGHDAQGNPYHADERLEWPL